MDLDIKNRENNKAASSREVKIHLLKQKAVSSFLMLRPKQFIKNLLVFAGIVFSLNLFNFSLFYYSIMAFISFCLLSGCVYILNDIIDIEEDKKHPRKRYRPLANGELKVRQAIVILTALIVMSLFIAWSINMSFFLIALLYFILAISYSLWLKHIVILDVFAVAFGFILRILAGGAAVSVMISPWLLVITLLLSLFLALIKRRQEFIVLENNGVEFKKVLGYYSVPYLDQLISIVTSATIIVYSIYTLTASRSRLFMITVPFVVYGIFRYLYLAYKKGKGESPEEILIEDKPMIVNILCWIIISVYILYMDI